MPGHLGGNAKATQIVGKNGFPMPIPLFRKGDARVFDSVAGEGEILARRIGRDKPDTIEVCLAFIDVQRECAESDDPDATWTRTKQKKSPGLGGRG